MTHVLEPLNTLNPAELAEDTLSALSAPISSLSDSNLGPPAAYVLDGAEGLGHGLLATLGGNCKDQAADVF